MDSQIYEKKNCPYLSYNDLGLLSKTHYLIIHCLLLSGPLRLRTHSAFFFAHQFDGLQSTLLSTFQSTFSRLVSEQIA